MYKTNWHALKLTEVFEKVSSTKSGLTGDEAQKRLKEHGANILPADARPSRFSILGRQVKSPLVYVLLIAAVVTAGLQEFVDMGVILAAVVVNTIIGFWQESKADQSFELLKKMIKHESHVLRDGHEAVTDATDLVAGDVVVLHSGDRIPADARLIEIFDFEVNEAALTGESMPIKKHIKALPSSSVLAERANMIFQGTTVARGRGYAVVVATGKDTAFGEIALLVQQVKDPITPLQEQLHRLAKILGAVTVVIAVGIFVIGIIQKRSLVEMFLTAVAVAVAAIPEGLLISLTVILAIGMRNLASRRAIVKRLIAAETLGSVSVICADKTGTLTTGEMRVGEIVAMGVKGISRYVIPSRSEGSHTVQSDEISPLGSRLGRNDSVFRALEIAVVGNEATIENPEAEFSAWKVIGDATPKALLLAGIEGGLDPIKLNRQFPKIDEIPFESAHKWAATLHRVKGGDHMLFVRGAPERLLEVSKQILDEAGVKKITVAHTRAFLHAMETMAEKGQRVVAVAYSSLPATIKSLSELTYDGTPPGELVFVGLFGIKDPLRTSARETIELAQGAGIRTVMITGDHAKTAQAIGAELGLLGDVVSGAEMDELDDAALAKRVETVSIFARVQPKHKVRIVEAFHALGKSVAMTGDGVNDAPALKAADIGIAVGSGTDVAKEAADVVLTDNNFKTIVDAVEGGRVIFENVKKVVAYLLCDSWTEIIIVAGSLLLGMPLPILAAQILWVNLIEDSLPNMALAFDPGDSEIMKEKPRERAAPLMDLQMRILIFGVGVTTSLLLFALYAYLFTGGYDLAYTRTMVFVGLGINSLFYIYSIRSLHRFIWKMNPFKNKYLIGSTVISAALLISAVYVPPLQHILRTVALSASDWLPLIGLGIINIALIELVKGVFIVKRSRRNYETA
ncbi:MAG: HAD-IC family P-type ATPase [bacterium]|nr:HAD-IC family P-type ATPase [bacterium]